MADSPAGVTTSTKLVYPPEQSIAEHAGNGQEGLDLEIHVNSRAHPSFSMRGRVAATGDLASVVKKLRTGQFSDFSPTVVDEVAVFDFDRPKATAIPSAVAAQQDADDVCSAVYGRDGAGGFLAFLAATYGLDRTGLPAQSPTPNCPGDVNDYRDVIHPDLGTLRISLVGKRSDENLPDGNACIAVTDSKGTDITTIVVTAYKSELYFAPTPVDAGGNLFVLYNPGRYDGVMALVPVKGSVKSIDRYNARLLGPGPDGQFTIEYKHHDCTPSCAEGPTTTEIQHWNGTDYVRQ
ncbi:hypothetical protein ACFV4K_29780 [Nocardia sp. NPDC059764]|uniref:hypothetical protein n=1 Tax=Nocardia sp. NPDC059764 TaxID=3346939 RepID=UPI00364E4469